MIASNQCLFLPSGPTFYLPFPTKRFTSVGKLLREYECHGEASSGVAASISRLMLSNPYRQIRSVSGVIGSVRTSEDIDPGLMHGLCRQGQGIQLPWIVGEHFDSIFDNHDRIRVAEPTQLRDI